MDANHKKVLRGLSLELRHVLEGDYDEQGRFKSGDLERRLNEMGVWRERSSKPIDELPHMSQVDKVARKVVDAYIKFRDEVGVPNEEAVAEYVRESAYTWANRLLALRCMEARGLIDEVILQKDVYSGRSLVHNRFARKNPEACSGEDDGLFAVLFQEFLERSKELPALFNPNAPAVALRPSVAAIKKCIAMFSGREAANGQGVATDEVFAAHDAFGWAYQYWNAEEKERVFENVRTMKGFKIEGANIIPATQLYTEPYMVKFLVQNSLGALWMGMHPESKIFAKWEYYVKDADRTPVEKKSVSEITFLDPAEGSGHFHLEAFDLLYAMYVDEGVLNGSESICAAILNNNLFGIDIDERAVQISKAVLWMKAKEKAPDLKAADLRTFHDHMVATNIRLPKSKDHLKAFLNKHPEDEQLRNALEIVFEGLHNANELGSLLLIEEPVEKELRYLKEQYKIKITEGYQKKLFGPTIIQGQLPEGIESYEEWKSSSLARLKAHFSTEAEASDLTQSFFSQSAEKGLALFDLLARRYDVVAANPPYMGFRKFSLDFLKNIKDLYPNTYMDLYTVFIQRAGELIRSSGYLAMISLNTWLTLTAFTPARKQIFNKTQIKVMAVLGTGTFRDLSNTNAMGFCMYVLHKKADIIKPSLFFDCTLSKDKSSALVSNLQRNQYIKRFHADFAKLPGEPIVYSAPYSILKAFGENDAFNTRCSAKQGLKTGDNDRFIRFVWECPKNMWNIRWYPCTRGGAYRRWRGNFYAAADWEGNGVRIRNFFSSSGKLRSRPQNTDIYFKEGITWTTQTSYGFSARKVDKGLIIESAGPLMVPKIKSDLMPLLGILNCRLIDFLFNLIQPNVGFGEGYIEKLPLPKFSENEMLEIGNLAAICVDISRSQEFQDIDSAYAMPTHFGYRNLQERSHNKILSEITNHAIRHLVEAEIESRVLRKYYLKEEDINIVYQRVGKPIGWFHMVEGYDSLLQFPEELRFLHPLLKSYGIESRIKYNHNEILQLKEQLRIYYSVGTSAKIEETDKGSVSDVVEDVEVDTNIRIISTPNETFLEELSIGLEIHPISVYWLLKEGIEKEGWRCLPEERRLTEDMFTVIVLSLLGHRWPKQFEAGEPVREWADNDGIIPITECYGEKILLERVREQIAVEFPSGNVTSIEHEFEDIIGMSLEKWLSGPFFERHISQFKKRPICWQIESKHGSNTTGKSRKRSSRAGSGPVFSCLVYYHKLDSDLLPKIRTQYVGHLKTRYETELRVLERTENPTADQSAREVQLGNWIEELKAFDLRLETAIRDGFNSDILRIIQDKEPIDKWTSRDGIKPQPTTKEELFIQEKRYDPDLNDGVRVNIVPLQKAGLLAADVIANKDLDKAISERAEWRADERRWCRQGKLPKPGWWKEEKT